MTGEELLPDMKGEQTPEAYYRERLRGLSGGQKVQIASDLYEFVKDVCRAGIRHQHPEYTPEEVEAELHRRIEYDRARSGRTYDPRSR